MDSLLEGVRILDLTRVLAGPYASMVLADLGAEVIKVELPSSGDESRGFGPFQNGESAYFTSVNRGKKSVTIDLRQERGRDLALGLAETCDVLVENFRPGSMDRFGLGYETVHAKYPQLVYASISGFGQTGPYAQRPAYDVLIQAMGGIASITGEPNSPPVRVGSSIADLSAALFGAVGILAALQRASRTGEGQQIDISMLDCQVALLENALARYAVSGEVPQPLGSRHPAITPFQFFAVSDGHIVLAAGNDGLWRKLCTALGLLDLIEDSRFADNALRTENHAALEPLLAEVLADKTVAEWCEVLVQAGVPSGPLCDVGEVFNDEQIAAREMIVEIDHPIAGRQAMPNSPLKFSQTPIQLQRPAPLLGQHTEEVLRDMLDLGTDEITGLHADGVI